MANTKISNLTSYTTPVSGDVLPINDTGNTTTKKVTLDNLFNILSSMFRIKDSTDTTKKVAFDVSGVTTGTTRTLTVPNANTTIVGTDVSQALTNKSVNGVTPSTSAGATNYLDGSGSYSVPPTTNASTTAKGVVEAATSAEVTAGTATGGTGAVLVITPDALASSTPVFNGSGLTNLTNPSIFKNGTTTYDLSTASGTTTIAHGCGKAPKYVRFTYFMDSTQATAWISSGSGVYNGTTNSTTYILTSEAMVFQSSAANSSECIHFEADNTGKKQTAVATYDATNITLTWTKTSTPTGTGYIMWEAIA